MKNQIFVALGLVMSLAIPSVFVANAETTIPTVDMQGEFVSFDDVVTALKGELKETNGDRSYLAQEKTFVLNHEKGYSYVNELPEPLFIEPSTKDSTVTRVTYTRPILFNEELFVPISYVERLLGLDYKDGVFEQNGEPLFKGEEFVSVTPPVDSDVEDNETTEELPETEPEKEEDNVEESKPEEKPSTSTPVQKPEEEKPSTSTPTQKPETNNSNNNSNSGSSSSTPTPTVQKIIVSQTTLKLEAGKSAKINAVVDPFNVADASITWTSGNTNVATVDNKGNVYAVGAGTTTLTVKSNMKPSITATVSVTVTPPPVIVATSISVNLPSVNLEVGESAKAIASIAPSNTADKGIKWSSENTSVATVDSNGTIVAKGAGTTRIVVTASSNGNAKAYIQVTVKAKPVSQPVYTGMSILNQFRNEGFWTGMANNTVFWSPYGPDVVAGEYDVEVGALNGQSGLDMTVRVAGIDWDNCFTYANKVFSKIIPSGASTIINALKAGQSGTWYFDGRKVTIEFMGFAYVKIYGKQ